MKFSYLIALCASLTLAGCAEKTWCEKYTDSFAELAEACRKGTYEPAAWGRRFSDGLTNSCDGSIVPAYYSGINDGSCEEWILSLDCNVLKGWEPLPTVSPCPLVPAQ